jgi:hypothetical protein
MKTRHAIYIESRIRKGTIEDFRKKENQRNRKYRKSLTDEERIALSKKHQDILRTKLKTVCKQNVSKKFTSYIVYLFYSSQQKLMKNVKKFFVKQLVDFMQENEQKNLGYKSSLRTH